jgi:hypothetical protein
MQTSSGVSRYKFYHISRTMMYSSHVHSPTIAHCHGLEVTNQERCHKLRTQRPRLLPRRHGAASSTRAPHQDAAASHHPLSYLTATLLSRASSELHRPAGMPSFPSCPPPCSQPMSPPSSAHTVVCPPLALSLAMSSPCPPMSLTAPPYWPPA